MLVFSQMMVQTPHYSYVDEDLDLVQLGNRTFYFDGELAL